VRIGCGTWKVTGSARYRASSVGVTAPSVRITSLSRSASRWFGMTGGSAEFTVPKFVEDPADLRAVAMVVIEAFERWEAVQGLGA
jgi:hypothetical protein